MAEERRNQRIQRFQRPTPPRRIQRQIHHEVQRIGSRDQERRQPRQLLGQLPMRQYRPFWRPLGLQAQFYEMPERNGERRRTPWQTRQRPFANKQKLIDKLQSLRQKAVQFPLQSKSDYFTNKLLATLNLQNCSKQNFQNELLTILNGLTFDNVVSEGPICRQKKTNLRYYRCFDCETNGTFACFCEECFQEEIHKDHSFKLYPKPCHCDCGDLTVLKMDSFCKKHREFIPENQITPSQYSLFYDCIQFLFFLCFELKFLDTRLHRHLLHPILLTIQLLTQNSYEYKKTIAKLFVSNLKECYQPIQKSILQQLISTGYDKDKINKILLGLYDVPSHRSGLIQKFWNYYTCYKYSSHIINDYQSLAILLFSEVDTIIRLLKEQKISAIDLKCLDLTQERIQTFFMVHRIMKNHVGYAEFIELTQVEFEFQKEATPFKYRSFNIQSTYQEYMINIIKALSKSANGIAAMKNMVKSSYSFIKKQNRTNLSQKFRTYYAEVCFSLTLFALYNFDLSILQKQPLGNILSLLDEKSEFYILIEQIYELLQFVSGQIALFIALEQMDNMVSKNLCFWFLQFKILLILQSKLQKELKYDMLEFKFQADIINQKIQDKPLNLYLNMIYAIETDFYEVIVANDLEHTQIQKIVQLLKMLKMTNNQNNNKKELFKKFCKWVPNFQQLRMSGQTQLYNLSETQESFFDHRVSFTSPFIPPYNTAAVARLFNMKKNSKIQRNELSNHFFSKYFEQKMENLLECVIQRFKAVTDLSLVVIVYVNKWLNLSSLLYLETKQQTFKRITLKLMETVPEFIFREQNKFHNHAKMIKANIIQVVIPEKKKQQSPKIQSKTANDKKLKMMNKIKQMQQNYMKKIEIEVEKQDQKKEQQHTCLICKMPDNLVILCNANKNTFLYSSLYGYQRPFLMITTCGHFVHQKCISPRNRRRINYGRANRGQVDDTQLYIVCELCKQQANIVIPFMNSYDLNLQKFSSQLEYLHQDIKCILYPRSQNKKNNTYKQNEQQKCLKLQKYELDQVLFESILFSLYFFFTSHSKFFIQKIIKVIKNVIAFMQIKLKLKGLNIRPLNIHMQDTTFKYLEQMLALLICHKESIRDRMFLSIEEKIGELQENEDELKSKELLKLILWLAGMQKYKISSKFSLQKFNLFNLPKDLVELNKISNKCQSCTTIFPSKLANLTNKTQICLMCGLISCQKCWLQSKKLHLHQLFSYNLSCESGKLNGFPLYTDEFELGPQECNKYALTARNLYKLNQNNYQKVLNCILASKQFKNIINQDQDRWERVQLDRSAQHLIVMPRNLLQLRDRMNDRRRDTEEQYDWSRRGQRVRRRGGIQRRERGRVMRRAVNLRGRFMEQ